MGAKMIVTQDYGWSQLARRQGLSWPAATEWAMDQAVQAGFDGWEPFLHTAQDAQRVGPLAALRGLAMPSVFVSGRLHTADTADMTRMVAAAQASAAYGATLVSVYPSPLDGDEKSGAQLDQQAMNLSKLARHLRPFGLRVLYHPEEPEMRQLAREFHHVLAHCDARLVGLCLDPDTFWRGCGRTTQAVVDVITRYGDRIDALHIRQSQGGVWAEVVGPGDLDYPVIATALQDQGRKALLVIEHAYEAGTPATLDVVAAHRQSLIYISKTFGVT